LCSDPSAPREQDETGRNGKQWLGGGVVFDLVVTDKFADDIAVLKLFLFDQCGFEQK